MFSSLYGYSGNLSAINGNSSVNLAFQKGYEGYNGSNNGKHQSVGCAFLIFFLSLKIANHSLPISLLLRYFAEDYYKFP